MKKTILFAVLIMAWLPVLAQANTQWVLVNSTLSYHMTHPIHTVNGVSHAAKGKGVCNATECNFLIAAPVKSFNSGDSNRDLHMLEVTRGAQYPMVVVRTQFPAAETVSSMIYANLDVQFAGHTAHYQHIAFQRQVQGDEVHITGTIPTTCSDFDIVRPSFLTVPIENAIPVHVEMTWRKM